MFLLEVTDIKGQLISEWFFGVFDFFQNRNEQIRLLISSKKCSNKFDFTTMIPQVDLFLFISLEEID